MDLMSFLEQVYYLSHFFNTVWILQFARLVRLHQINFMAKFVTSVGNFLKLFLPIFFFQKTDALFYSSEWWYILALACSVRVKLILKSYCLFIFVVVCWFLFNLFYCNCFFFFSLLLKSVCAFPSTREMNSIVKANFMMLLINICVYVYDCLASIRSNFNDIVEFLNCGIKLFMVICVIRRRTIWLIFQDPSQELSNYSVPLTWCPVIWRQINMTIASRKVQRYNRKIIS